MPSQRPQVRWNSANSLLFAAALAILVTGLACQDPALDETNSWECGSILGGQNGDYCGTWSTPVQPSHGWCCSSYCDPDTLLCTDPPSLDTYECVEAGFPCPTNPYECCGICNASTGLCEIEQECTINGGSCIFDPECCSGYCGGGGLCEPPPGQGSCVNTGRPCDADPECCTGICDSDSPIIGSNKAGTCRQDNGPQCVPQVDYNAPLAQQICDEDDGPTNPFNDCCPGSFCARPEQTKPTVCLVGSYDSTCKSRTCQLAYDSDWVDVPGEYPGHGDCCCTASHTQGCTANAHCCDSSFICWKNPDWSDRGYCGPADLANNWWGASNYVPVPWE